MFHSFHNCCQSFLFSHRHKLGLKRQMKKKAKMQDIYSKETKTTAASLSQSHRAFITFRIKQEYIGKPSETDSIKSQISSKTSGGKRDSTQK